MNKDTFVEMTVMGGMIAEDRRLLNSCFDEETGEVDADSFMEYCLMKLQLQTTLRIQGLNKQIADAIHELGVIGQWTNLIQVHRSLPDCIKDAVRNESFEEDITNWVNRQNKWDGLAAKQQEAALAFVEEQEWKVKNRQP
jgi:hypothetical protein